MLVSPSWLGCSTIRCTTSRYKISISGASGSCICYITWITKGGGGAQAQCVRSATIRAFGCTRNPYFVILWASLQQLIILPLVFMDTLANPKSLDSHLFCSMHTSITYILAIQLSRLKLTLKVVV